jgi:hypothetical protein
MFTTWQWWTSHSMSVAAITSSEDVAPLLEALVVRQDGARDFIAPRHELEGPWRQHPKHGHRARSGGAAPGARPHTPARSPTNGQARACAARLTSLTNVSSIEGVLFGDNSRGVRSSPSFARDMGRQAQIPKPVHSGAEETPGSRATGRPAGDRHPYHHRIRSKRTSCGTVK